MYILKWREYLLRNQSLKLYMKIVQNDGTRTNEIVFRNQIIYTQTSKKSVMYHLDSTLNLMHKFPDTHNFNATYQKLY